MKLKKTLWLIILLCFASITCAADINRDTILIYSGPGASEKCIRHCILMLCEYNLPVDYKIRTVGPDYLLNTDWQTKTKLLIMPGGADLPYVKFLRGKGNKKIKQFVQQGGSYLGICAGSYYAGNYVEFAKGDPVLEVLGARELAFFPGSVIGPVYSGFRYDSHQGVRTPGILWKGGVCKLYYHAGGYFSKAAQKKNIYVIATYEDLKKPAIIQGQYGKGRFILSAVHFEITPDFLNFADNYPEGTQTSLKQGDAGRKVLVTYMLNTLLGKESLSE